MTVIQPEELQKRLKKPINPLLDYLEYLPKFSPEGPWLCGGSVRRVFDNDSLKHTDFDLFFRSPTQKNECGTFLLGLGAQKEAENDKNTTYYLPRKKFDLGDGGPPITRPEMKIQLIHIVYYETLESVLESFDFTICQFGYDGTRYVVGPWSLSDLATKSLVPHKLTFGVSSLRRVLKYTNQGYTICAGGLGELLTQVVANPAIIQAETEYID